MFLSRSDSPTFGEAEIHGMCVSLNAPVVNIEALPVGPARAIVVLHGDEQLGVALTVAIRSLETGRVVMFTYQGELKKASRPTLVMDGALSFAEGMGFLFDEELIEFGGLDGRQRALRHWSELVGGRASAAAPSSESTPAPALTLAPTAVEPLELEPTGELFLDHEITVSEPASFASGCAALDSGSERESVDAAGTAIPAEAVRSPQTLPLTKFRRPSAPVGTSDPQQGEEGSSEAVTGPSRLGRVPIVKMRKGSDGPLEADLLIRLLGRF